MLSENLKNLRKAKGFSQEELAARLHVVRQTVSKWEKGRSVPDAELLVRLAEELDTTPAALLGPELPPETEGSSTTAEQLGRIAEQLAVKNRRARRIWKIAAGVLIAFAAVNLLLKMDRYLDLVIPRGGERLIRLVCAEATMPVLKHYKGVCHLYVDAECDVEKAVAIVENAKCQRPSACNALETLLIDRRIAEKFIPPFLATMKARGVELRGDAEFRKFDPSAVPATEEDWFAEYLDLILAVKMVGSVEEAVAHINHYGSRHSDGIISSIPADIDYFFANVDSATLYCNASTRFTDGGEFGMGAEIGISTDKLHARGPMGADELTSYKYLVRGDGQIRS